ncbi:hypothetical protein [Enterocloster bolteae]|uniref:hypothetical protein n=1 Tax=Enterocloster bolteae TaxID=208479 RepID=UPI00210F1086|nr:hypothetical protein [Enterocloster bolteae]MCQ5145957.1 hypothetical protein [Enterocloster bolteae]
MVLNIESLQAGPIGYLQNGEPVTNFILHLMGMSLRLPEEQRVYHFKIVVDGNMEYIRDFTAAQLNGNHWLRSIGSVIWIKNKKNFYQEFQKALITATKDMEVQNYILDKPGCHIVNGELVFVFSDGAITADGFKRNVFTSDARYYYAGQLLEGGELRAQIQQFMDTVSENMRFLYPAFLMNILSVLSAPLKEWGINPALTLWIDGSSGSGKTSLAKTIATFTKSNVNGGINLLSSTERTKNVVQELIRSSGIPVIIDDVKYENTQRQREKSRISIDIILRSIYQGEVTEQAANDADFTKAVDTCSIITGEYMETSESQNARLIYMNITEFIQKPENRKALKCMQDNSTMVGSVMGGFIRWWIKRSTNPQCKEVCCSTFYELREQAWMYETFPNGQRLKNTRAVLKLADWLFGTFINETCNDAEHNNDLFFKGALISIDGIVKKTFELLAGLEVVVKQAMEEVLRESMECGRIRKAAFRSYSEHDSWDQEEFCLLCNMDTEEEDDFVLIYNTGKSLEKRINKGELPSDYISLIIKRDRLIELIQQKLRQYVEMGKISMGEVNKVNALMLARMQVIYAIPRSDGGIRAEKGYPFLKYRRYVRRHWDDFGCENDCSGCHTWYLFDADEVPAVQCNVMDQVYHEVLEKYGIYPQDEASCPELSVKNPDKSNIIQMRKSFQNGMCIVPKGVASGRNGRRERY